MAFKVIGEKRCPNCIGTAGLDVAPAFYDSGGNIARCTRPCHVCGGTMRVPVEIWEPDEGNEQERKAEPVA